MPLPWHARCQAVPTSIRACMFIIPPCCAAACGKSFECMRRLVGLARSLDYDDTICQSTDPNMERQ